MMITEPALALDDIQGIVVPGFLKPHQVLLCLSMTVTSRPRIVGRLLAMMDASEVTSGRQALANREQHRSGLGEHDTLRAVAFTASGLEMLCPDLAATVPSVAFRDGMAHRASLLGDPNPKGWKVGGTGQLLHLMLVVAGSDQQAVQAEAAALYTDLISPRPKPIDVPPQPGNVRLDEHRGHEHFSFADGISQPAIRGVWNGQFITAHDLPPSDPEHDLFGRPGQHRVWPGEFVLGYPGASPDPRLPGPVRQVPAWMHNGSFLVYRRLRQHVHQFKKTMAEQAVQLRSRPGFQTMSADRLAALLVGRWPSGAPLSRMPHHDCPPLGESGLMNNDFRFDDDTPPRNFAPGALPPQWLGTPPPAARADPLGLVCPVASHIRKVNLRDQASDVGGASATQSRRILRVGVPYGDDLPDDATEDDGKDRGLLFLSIQASIEDQFEFLQARWINSAVRPRGPGGNDMVVGRGKRRCVIFGEHHAQAEVVTDKDFVTMTGGGYFFVPSLTTLRHLLQGALPPA